MVPRLRFGEQNSQEGGGMGTPKRTKVTRLVGWLALAAVFLGAASVTAFALTRGTNAPPKRTLAGAISHSLAGKQVAGITADVKLNTNLLPGASSTFSTSPLAGATGQVWATKGHIKLSLHSSLGNTVVGFSNGRVTLYLPKSHTAYVLPLDQKKAAASKTSAHEGGGLPSTKDLSSALAGLSTHWFVSGAIPGTVAGQPAYTVRIQPRHNGGLFGTLALAFDANHPVPLRIALYPKGSGTPAIELVVTKLHFGAIPASDFRVAPAGATVHVVHPPSQKELQKAAPAKPAAVFQPSKTSLAGMKLHKVHAFSFQGHRAVVLVYGRGLGSVVVLEQRADPSTSKDMLASLPAVKIGTVRGHELDTTLGTLVRFTHGGLTYTIVGSQRPSTIVAAASALQG